MALLDQILGALKPKKKNQEETVSAPVQATTQPRKPKIGTDWPSAAQKSTTSPVSPVSKTTTQTASRKPKIGTDERFSWMGSVSANPVVRSSQNMFTPAPTFRGAVKQVQEIGRTGADAQTMTSLWDALYAETKTPGSAYYNAYSEPTSRAVSELNALGIQVPDKMDEDWLADAGAFIATYQRNTATGVTAAAPTKSSSAEENTAYWLSRFLEDYDTTQAAKNESLALDRELSYWIGRGYSDDAAIAKIDYADYPTLAKMREAQGVGEPLQLTEALPFSDDWLYAKAWAARNPDSATGDYMTDLMQMGMGRGVSYKPDPQSDAARDPSNVETYNPYMFGATNDGLRMKYGVDSWDMEWLEQNRSMLSDEATADDWRTMYDAAQNTSTARAELAKLQESTLKMIGLGKTFEEIFGKRFASDFREDYPTLAKMEDYRYRGTSIELSDTVDFAFPYFREWVRDKIAERDAGIADTSVDVTAGQEVAEAPEAPKPEAAISDLEAELRLRKNAKLGVSADMITPEAMNAINALLPVSMTSKDVAARLNEAIANGEELNIRKIFGSSGSTANTKPMSATNTFTVDDTLTELAGLKERALVGINVNPDKLPASVQGVIDDAFMEELTNAIKTDDEMTIRRLFDEAAQSVQDAAKAPEAEDQLVLAGVLVDDLQALRRRAVSEEDIPIAALSETLLGAIQAATGMDAETLNAEIESANASGDMSSLIGWIDQAVAYVSDQMARPEMPVEQGMERGNVDLENRPRVPDSALVDAGWMELGEANGSYATVYSTFYTAGDRNNDDGFQEEFGMQKDYQSDKEMIVHVTPILSDGNVLTPEELEDYVRSAIDSGDVMAYDAEHNSIVLAVDDVSKSLSWQAAWQSAEEYDEALHVEQEKLYSQEPEAEKPEPVKKWDWADYYTKQSTMSETDFKRYQTDMATGVQDYLRTGETTNAAALSFLDSFGDLFEGERFVLGDDGKERLVDLREKYGNTIMDAFDAVDMDYVDPYQYVMAAIEVAQAYDEAMNANNAGGKWTQYEADMQAAYESGAVSPFDVDNVYHPTEEVLSAERADLYFKDNPDALAGLLSVGQASQDAAVADKDRREAEQRAQMDEMAAIREEKIAEVTPAALEAITASQNGTATQDQVDIVKAVRMVVTDVSRGNDDTYAKYMESVRVVATNGMNRSATMSVSETYEYQIDMAVSTLAMNEVDDHLGIAMNLGMPLGEFYERNPDLYMSPEERVAAARERFVTEWGSFGKGIEGLYDAAIAIQDAETEQDRLNTYDPEAANRAGIGMLKAIGMGIPAGIEMHAINWLDAIDAYVYMGVDAVNDELAMRLDYDTRAEAYQGTSKTISEVRDPEYKAQLERMLANNTDIYSFGASRDEIRLHDELLTRQANQQAAYQALAEVATPSELSAYNVTASLTNSALMAVEYAGLNAVTGGTATGIVGPVIQAANATIAFGVPSSTDFAREMYARTQDRGAAITSGFILAGVDGIANSLQFRNFEWMNLGPVDDGVIQAMFKKGFESLVIQNPGTAGRMFNALTALMGNGIGLGVGEGVEEMGERVATEVAESIVRYGFTGTWQNPDFSGIIEDDFALGALNALILGGVGKVVSVTGNAITGGRAALKFDQAAMAQGAVDYMAAKNVAAEVSNGALNPILQGTEAANLTKAEADLVNARVIFADTQTTIAEQARLQADAEATFLTDVTDENLAMWDSATEALEAAQANLEGAQNKVATAEQAVENAKGILFDAVAGQVDQIRAKARQDAEAALKDKNIIVAAKGAAKDIDTAKAKLQALDPKSPARAVLAAQIEAMETSEAVADFESRNIGALMKPGTKRGEAARAQFDSLKAAEKAAQEQLTKLTPDPQKVAQDTLDKALTQYREGTAPSDMIAIQGVKVAQLGVKLADAEKAYAQTQEALRNATGNYISADFSGRAPVDIGGLLSANDTAKASLDSARAAYNTQKTAMRSAVTDVVTDTLAKSDSDLAQQIADAIAANDRQGVENLVAEAADAGIIDVQGEPNAVSAATDELMSGGEKAMDIAFRIATMNKPISEQTQTTAFKKWFGSSRAVNEDGTPKIMYHGTPNGGFTVFDTFGSNFGLFGGGSYFTDDPNVAQEYADRKRKNAGERQVYQVFVKAENPIDMDASIAPQWAERFKDVDFTESKTNEDAFRAVAQYMQDEGTTKGEAEEAIQEALRDMGYDSVTHIGGGRVNKDNSARHRVFIVFDPEQVKSATDNIGTFSAGSPDIRFKVSMNATGTTVNPGTPSGRIRNPVQIARSLIKALGVGDYIGAGNMNAGAQVTIPQTAQGYYVQRANYIVANRENAASFATTMHEAGHALSAKLGLDATDDMVNALPQALKDAYPQSSWRGEAFAEFVYDYMLNGRESAIKNAGADFVNTFEAALRTNKLYDIVNEHAIAAREYKAADADTKIRAVVVDVPPEADKEGFWTKAISRYVDSTRAIAPLDKAIGDASGLSIRQQARYRTFRERMAVANLDKVGTDANGNIVGKSMAQTIDDTGIHGRDFNTLNDYMVAKHALDLMNRDEPITVLPDTITRAELEQLVNDVESKNKVVADGAKAINAWWNAFMQRWFVDTGLLSQQEFDAMKAKNPHYVPLMKAYEDSGTGKKRGGSSYKLTFIKSNTAEIANPFNSYAKIVREIGRLVAQNEVARAVHEAYQSNPGLGVFMRDVAPATRLPSARAQAQAEIDEAASALGNPTGENPYAKFVVEGLKRSSLDPSTRILRGVDRDGKVFQYEIAKGQDDLMRVLGSPASAQTGLEAVGRLTRIMSMLITGKNPLFAMRNAVRDIQSSINYGSWATTIFDGIPKWIAAMTDVIANKDSYKQYVAMGGGGYSFLTSGTTKGNAEYRADLFKGSTDRSAGGMARYGGRKLLKLITLEGLNEAIEQTSRYAEFKYGKADTQGKYDRATTDGRQRMLLSAQDVTVDFTLAGNSQAYRAIKQVIPFFGPSVQGVYRAFRMFSPEERGRLVPRLVKTIFNYSLRAAAQYALLSLLADDDDWDEYARLDDVYKAKHLFIPVKRFGGDDEGGMLAVKLPTSEDPVSRALYTLALAGVGKASDKFSLDIMATMGSNIRDILPDGSIASPLLDTINNQTYLGTPIVSQSLESRTGIDQYEDDTARSFVGLSKIMYDLTGGAANISPEKLQYLAEQYSGVLGQLAIPLMGTIGQADGAWYQRLWADTSRQFMTDTTYSNRYGNLFYQYRDGFTEIIKAGDMGGVASDLNPQLTDAERKQAYTDAKALTSSGGAFNTASKNVAALYAEIDANNTNANLTWAQRSDLNRVLRERINDEYNIANAEAEKYFGQYGIDRGIVGRFQVIAGGGSDAQKLTAPTKIETLPDAFQGDVADGADYISRAEELIAENPTLTTVYPNPPRTVKDGHGNEYTISDNDWPDFTQTYYDTYIDFVENISDDDWANMDNEARVEFYQDAHREASEDAKRDYLMYYA